LQVKPRFEFNIEPRFEKMRRLFFFLVAGLIIDLNPASSFELILQQH
jgi:hypothetical protein